MKENGVDLNFWKRILQNDKITRRHIGIMVSMAVGLPILYLLLGEMGFRPNLIAQQTESVLVTWNANTESDLDGYQVHFGDSTGRYDKVVPAGVQESPQVEIPISMFVPGKTYYFAVTAFDTVLNESEYSDEVILFIPVDEDKTAPGKPENVKARLVAE